MIIGYNFLGNGFHGNVFDTAIPTSEIDEVTMGAGIYDELFVSLNTTIDETDEKPEKWEIKTIMDAKFQNDVEAGTIDADGHVVTRIHIYRRKYGVNDEWLMLGDFEYDKEFNVYSFVDRLAENGVTYEYAVVPVAATVIGDVTLSAPIKVEYDGMWISDIKNNFKLNYDFELGEISHNTNYVMSNPISGKYPIMSFGSQDYKTGSATFLPLSEVQEKIQGRYVDGHEEFVYREKILDFLKSGGAKVIRVDTGQMLIVATHDVKSTPKSGRLVNLESISFSYTEIGAFDYSTMQKGGLIGGAVKSKYTFDDKGDVVWTMSGIRKDSEG